MLLLNLCTDCLVKVDRHISEVKTPKYQPEQLTPDVDFLTAIHPYGCRNCTWSGMSKSPNHAYDMHNAGMGKRCIGNIYLK